MSDLMDGLRSLGDHLDDYVRAERYYDGDPEEFFLSARIQRLLATAADRFRINMAKTPVNAVAARCRVAAVVVEGNDAATDVIQEIWEANDLDLHAQNWTRRAAEYGDAYVVAWPYEDDSLEDDDDEGGEDPSDVGLDPEAEAAGVELTYVAPTMGRMIYDTERPTRKLYFIMRWKENDRFRANVFYADRIERWIAKAGTKGTQIQEWERYDDAPIENPYGQIPVFHFRTDAPYGRPEHIDAYSLQDAINKLFITHIGSVEGEGAPQRYGLLDPASVLTENQDDPDWDDDADAPTDTSVATASSSLRGPGTMQILAGMKAVGEWGTADPERLLGPMSTYVRIMAHVTDTPIHHFDLERGDQPSGSALQKKDAPFQDKVRDRQRWFRATMRELWRFALKLRGITLAPGQQIDVRWEPPEVAGDTETWTVADLKRQAGVPTRQILLELGYQPDQVDEWLDETGEDMALAGRVNLLLTIAEAVQRLGTGIGFGILTKENASDIIEAVIGQVVPGVSLEVPEPEPGLIPADQGGILPGSSGVQAVGAGRGWGRSRWGAGRPASPRQSRSGSDGRHSRPAPEGTPTPAPPGGNR